MMNPLFNQDPWGEMSMWMQRRQMLDFCRKKFDMGDTIKDVDAFIELIDLGLRARIRFLHDMSVRESIESIPMPPSKRKRKPREAKP